MESGANCKRPRHRSLNAVADIVARLVPWASRTKRVQLAAEPETVRVDRERVLLPLKAAFLGSVQMAALKGSACPVPVGRNFRFGSQVDVLISFVEPYSQ
jgi:hypothetical protein